MIYAGKITQKIIRVVKINWISLSEHDLNILFKKKKQY